MSRKYLFESVLEAIPVDDTYCLSHVVGKDGRTTTNFNVKGFISFVDF